MARVFFSRMQAYYKKMRDVVTLKRVEEIEETTLEEFETDPCVSSMELMMLFRKK